MTITKVTSAVIDIPSVSVALASDLTANGINILKSPKSSPTFTGDLVINGSSSGSITLHAPAAAGTTTLTLPVSSGTILSSGSVVTVAQGGTGLTTLGTGLQVLRTNTGATALEWITPSSVTLGGSYIYATGDNNYNSNSLLLHCDGANTSTVFTDNSPSPKTVTPHGDIQIRTAQSKFGGASAYFDGTGDYLNVDGSTSFAFGTGDFTIECWINTADRTINQQLFDFNALGGVNGAYPSISYDNFNHSFKYSLNGGERCVGTTQVANNTWYHVAVCRLSGSTKLYINGNNEGSAYSDSTSLLIGANAPYIGMLCYNSSAFINGYLDDIRITKGVARYTTNFSVPVAAFPNNGTSTPPYYPVQWNNNGVLGGSSVLIWDNTNNYLGVNKATPVQALDVVGNIAATGTLTAQEVIASNGIVVNNNTISTNYTIATGYNAMSVGPITVSNGTTVTVTSGQRWVVL